MKTIIALALMLIVVGCSSQPKVEPRTVWINGYPIKENCMYADEQWVRILPELGSDNVHAHQVHTSSGTYSAARIGNQTYVCNRSALEAAARK